MRAQFGYDAGALKQGTKAAIEWDFDRVMNPHIMIAGGSGAGKSHTIRKFISEVSQTARPGRRIRFHVFDAHGDMHIPGSSSLLFSEQGHQGLNPLRIDPDPHYGGVRKRVQNFIRTLNRVSTLALGVKQEACLRNILYDVYAIHGFRQDDPSTWLIDESQSHLISDGSDGRLYLDVPRADFEKARSLGVAKWDPARALFWVPVDQYVGSVTQWPAKRAGRTHPTLRDVLAYARRILIRSFMGSDEEAVTCLEAFNRAATAYQRRVLQAARRGQTDWRDDEAEAGLSKAADKAIDAYTAYVGAIRTGRELDNVMKYDSTDVLKSVCDRLEGMVQTGIFKEQPISFDGSASVLVYDISPLADEEKRMFVTFRLEELYGRQVQRGVQDDWIDVYIVDEFGIYTSVASDPESIYNVIACAGRKYSACLVCAHQNPTAFPDNFMSSVATKVILSVDEQYWKALVSKMRIEDRLLAWIKPRKSAGIQIKERAGAKAEWRWVVTDLSAVSAARSAHA